MKIHLFPRHKFLSLITALILLAGCAGPASTSVPTLPPPIQTPATPSAVTPTSIPSIPVTTATSLPTPAVPANVVHIRFYYPFTTLELVAFNQQVAAFNQAHPEIVVDVDNRYTPTDNGFYATFTGSFDCFVAQNDPQGAAASGRVLDLNPLLAGEPAAFTQDFNSALLAAARDQGELYDMPFTSQPVVISYNADLLTSLGLKVPSNDWTFTDFLSLVKAATTQTASGAPQTFGFLVDGWAANGLDFLFAGPLQWLDTSGALPAAKFNTPQMEAALTWFAGVSHELEIILTDFWDPGWSEVTAAIRMDAPPPVAFWLSLAGVPQGWFQNVDFKIGVAPLPQNPAGGQPFQQSYDRGFYISKQSQHAEACWQWFKFISTLPDVFPGIPARKSTAATPAWEASVGPEAAAVYRLAASRVVREGDSSLHFNRLNDVDHALTFDPLYVQGPLRDWELQAMQTIYSNRYDLRQVLVSAQQKMDGYLACLRGADLAQLTGSAIQEKVIACAVQADPLGHW